MRMSKLLGFTVFALLFVQAHAEPLNGSRGSASGPGWQSSWLDLHSPTSFRSGEKLRLSVSGTAENIVVRLLPNGAPPSGSAGIEGGRRTMPVDGILEIELSRSHPDVVQISVHGGRSAWDYALGANNGSVNLVSVERISDAG